jgi:predicted nucleic acid-binding protein
VIVLDTSILSLAFRRRRRPADDPPAVVVLRNLISADIPLAVPGIVVQELLSGVRTKEQFRAIRNMIAGFPILLATESHHLRAAQIFNSCRDNGIGCSTVDALIAALTVENNGRLFTADADFGRIASCSELELFAAPP